MSPEDEVKCTVDIKSDVFKAFCKYYGAEIAMKVSQIGECEYATFISDVEVRERYLTFKAGWDLSQPLKPKGKRPPPDCFVGFRGNSSNL